MTLARLDRIETNINNKVTSLHLSGVDLVDGTPVIDVKPFVPLYDSDNTCSVPDWVSGGLALRRKVSFSSLADEQLSEILKNKRSRNTLRFYGRRGETIEEALVDIRACIEEVLAIDVRSQWQTTKARKGKFHAERAARLRQGPVVKTDPGGSRTADVESAVNVGSCTQQLDNLLITFKVQEGPNDHTNISASNASGAEDCLIVTSIELLQKP